MPYRITVTKPAYRMIRKFPKHVREYIVETAQQLVDQPTAGSHLEGQLRHFRCLRTVYRRTHYRIVYEVNERLQEIIIRAVGTRENFYQQIKRLQLKPLSK